MPLPPVLSEEFAAVTRGRVRFDEPMRAHTTFHVGGPAQVWVEPADAKELGDVLAVAREAELPVTVIGAGANLLVRDDGIPGVVIHLGHAGFQAFRRSEDALIAGAGLPLEWLIRRCLEQGLSGVEFLAGVPGRVGGALRMNAGTHDDEGEIHSVADVVRSVTVMNPDGRIETVDRDSIGFGYRSSRLGSRIILEASLQLLADDPPAIDERVKRLWEFKRRTQDWSAPSAGCIFKNPSRARGGGSGAVTEGNPCGTSDSRSRAQSAGWLIERAGLKGRRVGGAAISRVHANFMMNVGAATAADVLNLIDEVQSTVRRLFGVELELEVQVLPKLGDER